MILRLASTLAPRLALSGMLLGASFAQGEAPTAPPPVPVDPAAFIEKTWASCAACHAAPDARVEHDARWIGLNRTTACLTGKAATPANRTRLMAYLKGGSAPTPPLVRASDPATTETHGFVGVPATSGSAYMRRIDTETKETMRLFWDSSKEGSRLALPHGKYELISYCFYRVEGDVAWTAAATVQEGQKPDAIAVAAASGAALPITPTIYHDLSATADGPKLSISFQLRNEAGDRMTLTRNGDLVAPTWIASAAEGTELATGGFVPT